MLAPSEGIPAGSLFGYSTQALEDGLWRTDRGTFSLGLVGDNIFLYCKDNLNQIRFLSGFTNAGEWKQPNLESWEYGLEYSALPEDLQQSVSSIALTPHYLNNFYNGPRDARLTLLQRNIHDPTLWKGSNQLRYSMTGSIESSAGTNALRSEVTSSSSSSSVRVFGTFISMVVATTTASCWFVKMSLF